MSFIRSIAYHSPLRQLSTCSGGKFSFPSTEVLKKKLEDSSAERNPLRDDAILDCVARAFGGQQMTDTEVSKLASVIVKSRDPTVSVSMAAMVEDALKKIGKPI